MRISLLLPREPFGAVLEQTLVRFWSEQHGQPYAVQWRMGRASPAAAQIWLANIYLNAIFTPDADRAIFDPIRREFARSTVWWKRPAQRAYTALAVSRALAGRLAQACLAVTPAVPDAQFKLLVAGNHKLRLLDRRAGVAYGILKAGFGPATMQRELDARQAALAAGAPVPALHEVADDRSWYCEQYVSATPLNRLPSRTAAQAAAAQAAAGLQRLLAATERAEDAAGYAAGLRADSERLAAAAHLLSATQRAAIADLAEALAARVKTLDGAVILATTHGDFQPANILADGARVWLIDWEYSAVRQAGYDALVLALGSRFPQGLGDRLRLFVEQGWPNDALVAPAGWPGLRLAARAERRQHAALFALEELTLRLDEASEPLLTRLDLGLDVLLAESARWLENDHA